MVHPFQVLVTPMSMGPELKVAPKRGKIKKRKEREKDRQKEGNKEILRMLFMNC